MKVFGKCQFCKMPIYTENKRCSYCGKKSYEVVYLTLLEDDEISENVEAANALPRNVAAGFLADFSSLEFYSYDDEEDKYLFVDTRGGIIYIVQDCELINTINLGTPIKDQAIYGDDCLQFCDADNRYFFWDEGRLTNLSERFRLEDIKKAFVQKNNIQLKSSAEFEYLRVKPEDGFSSATFIVNFSTVGGVLGINFNISIDDNGQIRFNAEKSNI